MIKKDNFFSSLSKTTNFYNSDYLPNLKDLSKLKKPFFLSVKYSTKLRIRSRLFALYKIFTPGPLLVFKIKKKKKVESPFCRFSKKTDKKKILAILKTTSGISRIEIDPYISKNLKEIYRKEWINNFFLNKRGFKMIVYEKNSQILGFLLLIKKNNNYRIDLIMTKKKFHKKGIAKAMTNFSINKILKTGECLFAGTLEKNLIAKSFYKSMNFNLDSKVFNFHLHGK